MVVVGSFCYAGRMENLTTFLRCGLLGLALAPVAYGQTPPAWEREGQRQVCRGTTPAGQWPQVLGATEATDMQVFYFDTTNLAADARGVSLRLRLRSDRAQVTVKWRADAVVADAAADCEVDVSATRATPACSWEADIPLAVAQDVLRGARPRGELLNDVQRARLRRLMGDADLANWRAHGPVRMRRWEIGRGARGKKWRLERWEIVPGRATYEVSYRADTSDAVTLVRATLDEKLTASGLVSCAQDVSKTRLVLQHHRR